MIKKDNFILKSKNKFGIDYYNYSKVNFINYKTKIILNCNIHKIDFEITPSNHLQSKTKLCGLCSCKFVG